MNTATATKKRNHIMASDFIKEGNRAEEQAKADQPGKD
jgi:hypothetical protein